jgi:hypothetical protein
MDQGLSITQVYAREKPLLHGMYVCATVLTFEEAGTPFLLCFTHPAYVRRSCRWLCRRREWNAGFTTPARLALLTACLDSELIDGLASVVNSQLPYFHRCMYVQYIHTSCMYVLWNVSVMSRYKRLFTTIPSASLIQPMLRVEAKKTTTGPGRSKPFEPNGCRTAWNLSL